MKKRRSQIIKDLVMDKINVLQAMESLNFILEDIDDEEIKKWVSCEINGYKNEDNLPEYRKANATLTGSVQIDYAIYNRINIPVSNKDAVEVFTKIKVLEPISAIMQFAKAERESEKHSLSLQTNIALVNYYKEINGTVLSAHRDLGIYTYNNILAIVKDKLLEIFKVLEKNYGNLDELYIDFSDNFKKSDIAQRLMTIVYNDNSIKIGNNNQISESIIGNANEN